MRIRCPHCQTLLQIASENAGTTIDCPKCSKPFALPDSPTSSTAVSTTASDSPWSSLPLEDNEPAPQPARPRREVPGRGKPVVAPKRPTYSRQNQESAPKKFPVGIAIGVGVSLLIIGGVVIAALSGGSKDRKPEEVKAPKPTPAPVVPRPAPKPVVTDPLAVNNPNERDAPAEVLELFQGEVNVATPARLAASLRPGAGASAASLSLGLPADADEPRVDAAASKMTLEEIKKAAVYIKVRVGKTGSTGSGFLIRAEGDTGYIATNHHVIRDALGVTDSGSGKPSVTVVFDSGLPSERSFPADILAYDPEVDLAVLRVEEVEKLPRPIEPRAAVQPTETQTILTYGFPFGDTFATGGRSPAITIGKGAVSSLRRDESGRVIMVQLDAALNPGNSGGPVLDVDGHLVGVAVATIKGSSGIGLAIPASELLDVLNARTLSPVFIPLDTNDREATFAAVLPVIDPFDRIKSIRYFVWAGEGEPPATKEPGAGFKPLTGALRFDVPRPNQGLAISEIRLPNRGASRTVLVQTVLTPRVGSPIVSAPVAYQLKLSEIRMATDTVPMSTFLQNLSRYQGQDVAVRGTMDLSSSALWNLNEVNVWTEDNDPTGGLVFLGDAKLVAAFPETPFPDRVPVRLTLRVGKTGANSRTHIRVARVDLIGRDDRVVRSMPGEGGDDEDLLTTVNREPDRFVGQSVILEAEMLPKIGEIPQLPQLFFVLPSGQLPRNLSFIPAPEMIPAIRDLNLRGITAVRLTARVDERRAGPTRVVVIHKIEMLRDDGQVFKVVR